jgi:hypothetical protein
VKKILTTEKNVVFFLGIGVYRKSIVAVRVRRSYSSSNVSVSHFASNPKKNLSQFFKLNLLIFVRDGGKCERFAFRFEPKTKFKPI